MQLFGGYQFVTGSGNVFGSDKVFETAWAGLRYETGPWAFTGACYYYYYYYYYYWAQNTYLAAAKATCQTVTNGYATKTPLNRGVGRQIALNCSGELNQGIRARS